MDVRIDSEKRIIDGTSRSAQRILLVGVALYCAYAILFPTTWHFIDAVNLIFHEAGHTLIPAFIFGEWLNIAAGSLFQISIPLVIIVSALFTEGLSSRTAVVGGMWLGQSISNVSVYAADAALMTLPLLGGDGVIHDWNYLLSSMRLLAYTEGISSCIYNIGIVTFTVSLIYGVYLEKRK